MLSTLIYLILGTSNGVGELSDLLGLPFVSGKLLLNPATGLSLLSPTQLRNLVGILQALPPKADEEQKVWFLEIDRMFHDKNLRIFYMPLRTLQKHIVSRAYEKIPDPRRCLIGLAASDPALARSYSSSLSVSPEPVRRRTNNFKITSVSRNSHDSSAENRPQHQSAYKEDSSQRPSTSRIPQKCLRQHLQ